MNQVQLLVGDPPYRLYDVIIYGIIAGHENVNINSPSKNRAREGGRDVIVLVLSWSID